MATDQRVVDRAVTDSAIERECTSFSSWLSQ